MEDERSGKIKCSVVTGPNGAPCPGDGGGRGGGGYGGGGGGYVFSCMGNRMGAIS